MDGVNYEDNSAPGSEGGAKGADDTQGSNLVMRSTGTGAVRYYATRQTCILFVGICGNWK